MDIWRKLIKYKKEIFVLILLASFTFAALSMFVLSMEVKNTPCHDCRYYFLMSEGNYSGVGALYNQRILTPFLAGLLPFDTKTNFFLFNYAALTVAAFIFYIFLKKLGYSEILSILGSAIFLFNPTIIRVAGHSVDALFFLFFIAGFYAILVKNDLLYFLTLLIGIFNKELILLLVPLYFIINTNILKTIYLSIIPVIIGVIMFLLRFAELTKVSGTEHLLSFIHKFGHKVLSVFSTFTFAWFLAIFGFKKAPVFVKRSCFLLLFIFALAPFSDTPDRVVFMAFPIIIPLILQFLRDIGVK